MIKKVNIVFFKYAFYTRSMDDFIETGAGAVPIKTARGWIHIAHGVRNTAAGLRYVLYCFNTPQDPGRSVLCVRQRDDLINRNLELLRRVK
ncbi:hypothetical protein SAMN02910263_03990 [Butyrivibrio sp. INlla16]|nr:hypothetical protein SAMN02910263_03990 [Butyrivibrio sp. INlla16]